MKNFVFRNYTVEYLFDKNYVFSDYNSSLLFDENCDAYLWFYFLPIKSNSLLLIEELKDLKNRLNILCEKLEPSKPLYLFTIEDFYSLQYVNSDFNLIKAVEDYNAFLREKSFNRENTYLFDVSTFFRKFSNSDLIDWKFYYTSQFVINPKLAKEFKNWLSKQYDSINYKRKKCIILDLDNTLWGGILGEDGAEGIKIGNTYPGNIFSDFQNLLLEASKAGIILAVCSKNNEKDVLDLWKTHPDLILREEHFSAYKINWNNKAENIIELAKELNIGLESMVFVDDNPVERNLVKEIIKDVTVPDFPDKIYQLPEFFKSIYNKYFQIYKINSEDMAKLNQYKSNAERAKLKTSLNIKEYLKSLETVLSIKPADKFTIPRISQMTQKTNQFNLTTQRYSESDIVKFLEQGNFIYTLSVKDKFGDNGITGLIILKEQDKTLIIDTLLLSCRILGRNIEYDFVKFVLNIFIEKGCKNFKSSYLPTLKNKQVEDFYDKLGFTFEYREKENKFYNLESKKLFEINKDVKIEYYE